MYRSARLANQPIHPALVSFPIVLYASTVASLVVYGFTKDAFWFRAAMTANIAGVVMAIVAAVPGAVDLFGGSPARSTTRRVGLYHAGFNVGGFVLFTITAAILWNRWSHREPIAGQPVELAATLPLVLAVLGLCATTIAGSLGWTLVQGLRGGVEPNLHRARPTRPISVGRATSQVRPGLH